MTTDTTSHSLFSASGSTRWLNCPGSLAVSQGIPSRSGMAAKRGTAAHAVAARILEGDDTTDAFTEALGQVEAADGQRIEIDEELAGQIEQYVEYVRGIAGQRMVEVKSMYGPAIGLEDKTAWGTADAVIIQPDDTIHVVDLKTGRGYVQAPGNTQLLLYAAGVIHSLQAVGTEPSRIVLHIVQPAVHAQPSTWELTPEEFAEEVGKLKASAQKAMQAFKSFPGREAGDVMLKPWAAKFITPQEDACRWCPAAAGCKALADVVPSDLGTEYVPLLATVGLNAAMARIPLIEIYVKAVQEEAYRRASLGEPGLAFKLVLGREGNRKFGEEQEALDGLRNLGVDDEILLSTPSLRSPAQIEKDLKKAKRKDVIEAMTHWIVRAPAKPTLVPVGDPREPWTENNVKDEFPEIG